MDTDTVDDLPSRTPDDGLGHNGTIEVRERVLVALSGGPESGPLPAPSGPARRPGRQAPSCSPSTSSPAVGCRRPRAGTGRRCLKQLAADVGARYQQVVGDDAGLLPARGGRGGAGHPVGRRGRSAAGAGRAADPVAPGRWDGGRVGGGAGVGRARPGHGGPAAGQPAVGFDVLVVDVLPEQPRPAIPPSRTGLPRRRIVHRLRARRPPPGAAHGRSHRGRGLGRTGRGEPAVPARGGRHRAGGRIGPGAGGRGRRVDDAQLRVHPAAAHPARLRTAQRDHPRGVRPGRRAGECRRPPGRRRPRPGRRGPRPSRGPWPRWQAGSCAARRPCPRCSSTCGRRSG